VGTSIANAPTLDLSMDIVEKDGIPISKRGKFGGRKYAYRCPDCLSMDVSLSPNDDIKCSCGCHMEPIEQCVIKGGKRQLPERSATEIRDYVMKQLKQISELE
jgi:nicotinate phosphoribosyltransferase